MSSSYTESVVKNAALSRFLEVLNRGDVNWDS